MGMERMKMAEMEIMQAATDRKMTRRNCGCTCKGMFKSISAEWRKLWQECLEQMG